jgi:hypothetical protein
MTTETDAPQHYGRVLIVWVVVLGALYAFQEYFS